MLRSLAGSWFCRSRLWNTSTTTFQRRALKRSRRCLSFYKQFYGKNDGPSMLTEIAGLGGILLAGQLVCTNISLCEKAKENETNIATPMGVKFHKPPRQIRTIDPPLHDFFSKEISLKGNFPLRAHASVSDNAMFVAADRLSFMLRYLPNQVIQRLIRRGASFHIIGITQNTSCLPEHSHMKGVKGGYTGEKDKTVDERSRGMGGAQASCGEENLIDLDADPRYPGRDILTHEFAHCIMDVGLPLNVRNEIKATFEKAVQDEGLWERQDGTKAYAGTNAQEYFAELSMWYFGSRGEYVDKKKQIPKPGPGGLYDYDKNGFELLASIYGGTHPALQEHGEKVERLKPLEEFSTTRTLAKEEVSMEFDNKECDCSWKLYWIKAKGERKQYGKVMKGTSKIQMTFPGHVWELELDTATEDCNQVSLCPKAEKVIQYAASESPESLAAVAEDSNCKTKKSPQE